MRNTTVLLAGLFGLALPAIASANATFVAPLSGAEQVPPLDTQARGNAIVKVRGEEMSYQLIVAGLRDVVASHIHCGAEGVNGPIGVTLYAGTPTTLNGILAQGPILMPDPGNACGWEDLSAVIGAIEAGDAYVNVHTLANLPGEIRGQLR